MIGRLKAGGFEAVATINDDGISPEVDLSFSKGDIFEHVHLCLCTTMRIELEARSG